MRLAELFTIVCLVDSLSAVLCSLNLEMSQFPKSVFSPHPKVFEWYF